MWESADPEIRDNRRPGRHHHRRPRRTRSSRDSRQGDGGCSPARQTRRTAWRRPHGAVCRPSASSRRLANWPSAKNLQASCDSWVNGRAGTQLPGQPGATRCRGIIQAGELTDDFAADWFPDLAAAASSATWRRVYTGVPRRASYQTALSVRSRRTIPPATPTPNT
jgi:hypothetical protein